MATDVRTPAAVGVMYETSAATFTEWVRSMHAALLAVGLVQTADTGQLNPVAGLSTPPAGSPGGYLIYRFNDTLQATAPVFIKIEPGAPPSSSDARVGGIWVTVGSGTNGAGTLTGVVSVRQALYLKDPTNLPDLTNRPIWTSGAANRIGQILARSGTSSLANTFWAVERTKDTTGNDTNEGVHIVMRSPAIINGTTATAVTRYWSQTLIFSIASAQAMAAGPMCVTNNDGTATDAGNTGFFPWQMASRRGNENPPTGWLSYLYGDINGSIDITVSMYGTNHVYRTLGADAGQSNAQGCQKAGWRPSASTAITAADSVHFAMRWE